MKQRYFFITSLHSALPSFKSSQMDLFGIRKKLAVEATNLIEDYTESGQNRRNIQTLLRVLKLNSIQNLMEKFFDAILIEISTLYSKANPVPDVIDMDIPRLASRVWTTHFKPYCKFAFKKDEEDAFNGLSFIYRVLTMDVYEEFKNDPEYKVWMAVLEKTIEKLMAIQQLNESERQFIRQTFFPNLDKLQEHDKKIELLKKKSTEPMSRIRFRWVGGGEPIVKIFFLLLIKYELIENDFEKFSSLFIVNGRPLNSGTPKIIWTDKNPSPTQIVYLFHNLTPDFIYKGQEKNINSILTKRIVNAKNDLSFLKYSYALYSKQKSAGNKSDKITEADTIIAQLKKELIKQVYSGREKSE